LVRAIAGKDGWREHWRINTLPVNACCPHCPIFVPTGVVGITAFGFMWFAGSAPVILPALFVTGLGMSLQWPLGIARILRSAGGRTDRDSGAALAFGTTAIRAGRFVLGALAEQMPIHQAFLNVPVMLSKPLGIVMFSPVPEEISEGIVPAGL
jgi:hypothetical protein